MTIEDLYTTALFAGLSSEVFWDMTFRELTGYYKKLEQQRLEEWDRTAWLANLLINSQRQKGQQVQIDNPLRNLKREEDKKFESQEDIKGFLASFDKPKQDG